MLFAAIAAGVILAMVVLPAEYGIDPTGPARVAVAHLDKNDIPSEFVFKFDLGHGKSGLVVYTTNEGTKIATAEAIMC